MKTLRMIRTFGVRTLIRQTFRGIRSGILAKRQHRLYKAMWMCILLVLLVPVAGHTQWLYNPADTTLHYRCEGCPLECRNLVVGLKQLTIGNAFAVDIIYYDHTSSEVYSCKDVMLGDTDTVQYAMLMNYVLNYYGWVEFLVAYQGGLFTYIIPTVKAYNAMPAGRY